MKMNKKILFSMLFFGVSSMAFSEDYFDYKALLVGDVNGNIIKEDNSSTVRPLASVTKIMTVILTMDKIKSGQISYDTKVTVSAKAAKVPYGVTLVAGKQYTVRDLLKATIIKSSNNAAYALGEFVGGSIPNFVSMMNQKAQQFGLYSLRYCSPNGLPPSYTGSCMDQGNAKDLYKLAQIVVKDYSDYLDFSRNKVDYIDNGNTKVSSTNTLLGNVIGVDGLKTGYHDAAGSNIVLTAIRDGNRMITVILGSAHAKDRNAIGAREINEYYANGYGRNNNYAQNTNNNNNNNNSSPNKGNKISQFFNSLVGRNSDGTRKIKVVNKNDIVAIVKIGNDKFNLYPAKDVEIEAKEKPRLKYSVTLNPGISRQSRGQVVGTYTATDGIQTFTGELIMK